MPNDFSVQTIGSAIFGNGGIASMPPSVAAAATDHADPSQSPSAQSQSATANPAPSQSAAPNPTLQLNAALGLVVIEFRNDAGTVTNSIPSQQQLNAYRLWQTAGIGSPPNFGNSNASIAAGPGQPTTTPPAMAPVADGGDARPSGSHTASA